MRLRRRSVPERCNWKGPPMVRVGQFVLAWLVLAAVATPRSAMAGLRVKDEKLGAAFSLPEGFEAGAPAAAAADGRPAARTFARGTLGADSFAVLQVVPLAGTIGPGKLDRKLVEDAARAAVRGSPAAITAFDYRTARWKTFDLDLVVGRVSSDNRRFVTLTTQVPLVRQALQLSLMGPADEEPRLATEFQSTLTSLEGESNWLNDRQRSERLGRTVGMLVGALVGGGAVLAVVRRRQRKSRAA